MSFEALLDASLRGGLDVLDSELAWLSITYTVPMGEFTEPMRTGQPPRYLKLLYGSTERVNVIDGAIFG
jgi:hypothetical protein